VATLLGAIGEGKCEQSKDEKGLCTFAEVQFTCCVGMKPDERDICQVDNTYTGFEVSLLSNTNTFLAGNHESPMRIIL